MSFQSLPQLLDTISNQESWCKRKQFQQLLACWFDLVGAVVATQTRPIGIQRRILQVATSSSVWAQNLAFERHRILEKLNARLELNLTDIRFSTAHWQTDKTHQGVENCSEAVILWRDHPSRINHSGLPCQPRSHNGALYLAKPDPQTAFLNWARVVRAQSQHLPLCPSCHSPTPEGELLRWSVCSLCAAQQFSRIGSTGSSLLRLQSQPLAIATDRATNLATNLATNSAPNPSFRSGSNPNSSTALSAPSPTLASNPASDP